MERPQGEDRVEAEGSFASDDETARYSAHTFGAQFAEVRVEEELCRARVVLMLGVFDASRIINPKTARSQVIGGMIFGLGMALSEETVIDRNLGHVVEPHLSGYSGYHVPVAADAFEVDALFV